MSTRRSFARAVTLAALGALASVAACGGKKAGKPCKPTEAACAGEGAVLACESGTFRELACHGPNGCRDVSGRPVCDQTRARAGEACGHDLEEERVCDTAGEALLLCRAGVFRAVATCKGAGKCTMAGRLPTCDATRAAPGDPCAKEGAEACGLDDASLVGCTAGAFKALRLCRGKRGCSMHAGVASCDQTVAKVDEACGTNGVVACDPAGATELVCQAGRFVHERDCPKGCVLGKNGRSIECR